jgi:hypothetical protein
VKRRTIAGALLALALCLGAAGCPSGTEDERDPREREEDAIAGGFDSLTRSQQIPEFDWSQERQTLIDVLTARANGSVGTAIVTGFNGELIWWCPTVGAPIPSTYQLSNPERILGRGGSNGDGITLPQGEPTGVYTGDSAATWTLCTDAGGTPFAVYEEGNVRWVSGVVSDLPSDRRQQVNDVTLDFSTSEEEARENAQD